MFERSGSEIAIAIRFKHVLKPPGGVGFRAAARKCVPLALAGSFALPATDGTAEHGTIEEVVVTAKTESRIGRQGDSPSPLSNYDGSALREAGLRDLRDLVGIVAINAGAENNADNLTQNFTVGTANINLRGLGVASTLVLLNGGRQVLSAVQTDDGSSFVDLAALVPALAIERMEVLKDGATAIYGSEAMAGVANFITRHGFEGIELQAEYRSRTGNGSQDDITLDGVLGGKIPGDGEFLLAASYLDRTSLVLIEMDWLQPATSGFGNPGSFNVPSLGRTIADAGSEQYDGLLQELANGGTICRFDYGPQITAVPNEQRGQAWGRVELPDEIAGFHFNGEALQEWFFGADPTRHRFIARMTAAERQAVACFIDFLATRERLDYQGPQTHAARAMLRGWSLGHRLGAQTKSECRSLVHSLELLESNYRSHFPPDRTRPLKAILSRAG